MTPKACQNCGDDIDLDACDNVDVDSYCSQDCEQQAEEEARLSAAEERDFYRDELDDRSDFADPGGRSALRAGPRIYPCPNCGQPNRLSAKDKQLGYQCDACADRAEGGQFFADGY